MPELEIIVPRRILGFSRDEAGDWVATLDCGHRRHVRHRPPGSFYPWVLDDHERAARVGASIECLRCARLELPEDATLYKATAVFDAASVPAGLLADHRVRAGSWGRLVVLEGQLRLVLAPPYGLEVALDPDRPGVIPPEIPHHVLLEPDATVRFLVEFLRVSALPPHS